MERIRDLPKWGWKLLPGNPIFNPKSQRVSCPVGENSQEANGEHMSGASQGTIGSQRTWGPWHQWALPLSSQEKQIEKSHFASQMNFCFCNSRMCSGCPRVLCQNTVHVLFQWGGRSSFYQLQKKKEIEERIKILLVCLMEEKLT